MTRSHTPLVLLLTLCCTAPGFTARATPPMPKVERETARRRAAPCAALKKPQMVDGRFAIRVKMNVDVDGAPTAYGPPGKPALDVAEHSIGPGDLGVVGYMTEYDGGPPTIQGPHDPAPGYYVSQTAFADLANKRLEDPRRYLDATKINYVVLGKAATRAGVRLGDFATVYSCRTGRTALAIVGDDGNESGAEGSLALVQALGYDIRDGNTESVDDPEIIIRFAPRSNPRHLFFFSQQALDKAAEAAGLRR